MAVSNNRRVHFSGIITPMVTPLNDDTTIDRDGLKRLVEHLIDGGIGGLFVLGTTGEAPSLSYELRREMISLTCEFANERIPVLVGITDSSLEESLDLVKVGAEQGVAAVVAAPPFYFSLNQTELTSYYRKLADKSSLPVFVYNMPAHTKTMIEVDTVRALSDHPNIIGIKDSSGNAPYFQSILYHLKDNPDFSIFVGPDEMLATSILFGADGGVNSGSNMFPELFTGLFKAAKSRDLEQVSVLQKNVMRISLEIYSNGNSSFRYLKGIKKALSFIGICKNILASPLNSFDENESEHIEKTVRDIRREILALA